MKTTLRYLSLNAQASWHCQVEEQLKHLHSLTPITAAEVVLEHQREAKPGFRVQVRLEVPGPVPHAKATRHTRQGARLIHGPALHAEARDNTIEAALLKATRDLEHNTKILIPAPPKKPQNEKAWAIPLFLRVVRFVES